MLKTHDLSVRLDDRQILDGITFALRPHRLTVLVGKNGSGKSTLLSCVNQQFPYTGEILEGERNLALIPPIERAKAVSILPQSLPAPHITVEEMVAFGRNPYLDFTGRLAEKDRIAVADAIKEVDAQALSGRYVDTLSGGERQRIALAMILAQNTPIALLDEPTAHMDQGYEAAFLQTVRNLTVQRKKTFLVVLHDLSTAVQYADAFLVLDGGKLVFSGSKEECLHSEILEKTFGVIRYNAESEDGPKIFFAAK